MSRLGQRKCLLVGGYRLIQQRYLLIHSPQDEVVIRELGLQAQSRGLEVGRVRLRLSPTRCDFIADAAPQIELVVRLHTDGE